ncbi:MULTISPECIES: DUF4811 domain-containing protein [Staphylococcus]|uniref:DUF4811 domain-containing protein n=1 Tax=Staphylococcus TaxID=1279 RepID=UPI0008A1857A|nr:MULTISPECIES: DUF4811 domain-containing protein [Staphylococcus]MBX8992749.1 DUF4811 domain-containing protein [Staphylococcus pettenkoferi]OFK74553.1 hypothetical protein HMPREF2802_05915 [Staphylococcus sp. HMSC071G07]
MIIAIILALLIFATWLFIPHKWTRILLGTISILLLLTYVIGLIGNMKYHWGMKQETVTRGQHEIYSAGPSTSPKSILIIKEIGNNSGNYVMIYKDRKADKKAEAHNKPDMSKKHISDSIKQSGKYYRKEKGKAVAKTEKVYWTWKNDMYRILFSFNGKNKELKSEKLVVSIPESKWEVMTPEQLKAQQQKMKQKQAQMKKAKMRQAQMKKEEEKK